MNALVVFAITLGGLFVASFLAKRRFGMLGLALCAGALLAGSLTSNLTPFLQQQGIMLLSPPLSSVVATALLLLPSLPLFFSAPKYNGLLGRIIGAIAYTLLGFVLLMGFISSGLVFDDLSQTTYNFISQFGNIIIVASIILAIADIVASSKAKKHGG